MDIFMMYVGGALLVITGTALVLRYALSIDKQLKNQERIIELLEQLQQHRQ